MTLFGAVLVIVSGFATGVMFGVLRHTTRELRGIVEHERYERNVAHAFAVVALQQLAQLQPCDICGQPFADGEAAVLRPLPGRAGAVFAHGVCLPPLHDGD